MEAKAPGLAPGERETVGISWVPTEAPGEPARVLCGHQADRKEGREGERW